MSELSELAFAAGWMSNLEHALWRAAETGPFHYGRLALSSEQTAQLQRLSSLCGGWICFDDNFGETFVRLELWRHRYDPALAQ